MSIALYRKYRSKSLDDIVGQTHVTEILQNAIKQGRISHAYLFTGPRGTGKTSIARILAHEINQLPYSDESEHLDIIEIDAASNNGVDDIRDLRDKVQLMPIKAKKKVYIIDEVHMLSKPAFNALLKTLEEPPEHIVFILATTDVDKLPETIISRTQRHTFHRASLEHIVHNLQRIAAAEKIAIDDAALRRIAENSDGSYRDSVSLLDQIVSIVPTSDAITAQQIEQSLGLAEAKVVEQLVQAAKAHDLASLAAQLRDLENSGIQPKVITRQLIRYLEQAIIHDAALLPLLDQLLTVERSSFPQTKLLIALGSFGATRPTHKATAATAAPSVTSTIPELEKKATQPAPKDDIVTEKPATEPTRPATPPKKKKTSTDAPVVIDLAQLLTDAKTHSIALHSVLEKCTIETSGDTCTIYAKNAFYKKKLDNSRFKAAITSALAAQASLDWEIDIIPSAKPPSSSQAAQVAAIMGGGEEVSVDE